MAFKALAQGAGGINAMDLLLATDLKPAFEVCNGHLKVHRATREEEARGGADAGMTTSRDARKRGRSSNLPNPTGGPTVGPTRSYQFFKNRTVFFLMDPRFEATIPEEFAHAMPVRSVASKITRRKT